MFIQVIQGQVAETRAARETLDRWARELAPSSYGWLGTTAGVTDDGILMVIVRFESPESARRNADRPEQTTWWQETAKLFTGEATFHDYPEVQQYMQGGSDSAGFVQVIQGRVVEQARLRELLRSTQSDLAGFRPDLIGGIAAFRDDGNYTETAYFTSEEDARQGEQKELPVALRESYEEYTSLFDGGPEFFDLRDPWLYSPR